MKSDYYMLCINNMCVRLCGVHAHVYVCACVCVCGEHARVCACVYPVLVSRQAQRSR